MCVIDIYDTNIDVRHIWYTWGVTKKFTILIGVTKKFTPTYKNVCSSIYIDDSNRPL